MLFLHIILHKFEGKIFHGWKNTQNLQTFLNIIIIMAFMKNGLIKVYIARHIQVQILIHNFSASNHLTSSLELFTFIICDSHYGHGS